MAANSRFEHRRVRRLAERVGNAAQMRHHLRLMLGERIENRLRLPHEDARVPVERAGGEKLTRDVGLRFLTKAHSMKRRQGVRVSFGKRLAAFDISETLGGIRRTNAKRDDATGGLRDETCGVINRAAKELGGLNRVVGRQHDHRCIGIVLRHVQSRQADARRGVTTTRLGENRARWKIGTLRCDLFGQVRACGNHYTLGRHETLEPFDRSLQHRSIAEQMQQLLGIRLATLGPEPTPRTSSHDHSMQHERRREKPRVRSFRCGTTGGTCLY